MHLLCSISFILCFEYFLFADYGTVISTVHGTVPAAAYLGGGSSGSFFFFPFLFLLYIILLLLHATEGQQNKYPSQAAVVLGTPLYPSLQLARFPCLCFSLCQQ